MSLHCVEMVVYDFSIPVKKSRLNQRTETRDLFKPASETRRYNGHPHVSLYELPTSSVTVVSSYGSASKSTASDTTNAVSSTSRRMSSRVVRSHVQKVLALKKAASHTSTARPTNTRLPLVPALCLMICVVTFGVFVLMLIRNCC